MAKWIYDKGKVPLEYPTLGFTAKVGDVLSATAPPDRRWSLCPDQEATVSVFNPSEIEGRVSDAMEQAEAALDAASGAFDAASAAALQIAGWTYTGTTEIDGGDIRTDTVTAVQLDANAITSKHTLTGPIIQTTATANREIKLNSSGFIAYNGGGTPTFSITAATGAVAMLGDLTSGSTVTGATVTGGTVRTANSSGGYRAVMETLSGAGRFSLYNNSTLLGGAIGGVFGGNDCVYLYGPGGLGNGALALSAGKVDVVGDLDLNSNSVTNVYLLSAVAVATLGGITAGGDLHGNDVYVDSLRVLAGGEAVYMGTSGRLYAHATPSHEEWKRDINPIEVDRDALADLDFVTWRYREDVPFEIDDLNQVFRGYTFDKAEELGLTDLIDHDDRLDLDVARPENLVYLVAVAWQKDHADLKDARARIADLEAALGGLVTRIEQLEGP